MQPVNKETAIAAKRTAVNFFIFSVSPKSLIIIFTPNKFIIITVKNQRKVMGVHTKNSLFSFGVTFKGENFIITI